MGDKQVAGIQRFEEIEAWQTARVLAGRIYALSGKGAFAQDFALRDQIRRAAISGMSNIAEGFESRTSALFTDFLGRAKGSLGEVRAQLYIALDCGYITREQFEEVSELADKAGRQIYRFMAYLQTEAKSRRLHQAQPDYQLTAPLSPAIDPRAGDMLQLDDPPSTANDQRLTINDQRSTINDQRSTIND
ncbi:MAG: four helix bundle protein [Candidatus Methanomethyliaceae archaeon]